MACDVSYDSWCCLRTCLPHVDEITLSFKYRHFEHLCGLFTLCVHGSWTHSECRLLINACFFSPHTANMRTYITSYHQVQTGCELYSHQYSKQKGAGAGEREAALDWNDQACGVKLFYLCFWFVAIMSGCLGDSKKKLLVSGGQQQVFRTWVGNADLAAVLDLFRLGPGKILIWYSKS